MNDTLKIAVNHRTIRTGDTLRCRKCGKQWDVQEDAPPCINYRASYLELIKDKGFIK